MRDAGTPCLILLVCLSVANALARLNENKRHDEIMSELRAMRAAVEQYGSGEGK